MSWNYSARQPACLTTALLGLVACGPDDLMLSSGNGDESGDGDGDGDGDGGDGDGDPHEPPCESQYEGMICIPAGPFIMGSAGLGYLDELEIPEQEVWLSQFHIDRREVTFGQYRACIEAGNCTSPASEIPGDDLTWGCRWGQEGIDEFPVACIDWLQAADYCQWRGAALPTEAQWEKAARGTDGRKYPWGDEDPTCEVVSMADEAEVWGCGTGMAELPGAHSPQGDSPYGVQDMSGNMRELVADWLGPGQAGLGADPTGPEIGDFKVSKGGSYHVSATDNVVGGWLQLAWRGRGGEPVPGWQLGPAIGFRCAISD